MICKAWLTLNSMKVAANPKNRTDAVCLSSHLISSSSQSHNLLKWEDTDIIHMLLELVT